jgi:hypothetical protein
MRPSSKKIAAKKIEISKRYKKAYDRGAHRVAEVRILAAHRRRHGCLDFDVDEVIRDIISCPRVWTARAIGHRLGLSWRDQAD